MESVEAPDEVRANFVQRDNDDDDDGVDENVDLEPRNYDDFAAAMFANLLMEDEIEEEEEGEEESDLHSSQPGFLSDPHNRIQCPMCSQWHEDNKNAAKVSTMKEENWCSHGCTLLFFALDKCPICLETSIQPSIALPCGHGVCPEDFVKIGGRRGKSMLQNSIEDH